LATLVVVLTPSQQLLFIIIPSMMGVHVMLKRMPRELGWRNVAKERLSIIWAFWWDK